MTESADYTDGNVKVMEILGWLSIVLQIVCSILVSNAGISLLVLASTFIFLFAICSFVDAVCFNSFKDNGENYSLLWHLIMTIFYGVLAVCMIFAPPNGVVFATIGCSFVIALSEALILLLGKSLGLPFLPCGKQQNSSTIHPQEEEISNDQPPPYNECVIDHQLPGYYEVV